MSTPSRCCSRRDPSRARRTCCVFKRVCRLISRPDTTDRYKKIKKRSSEEEIRDLRCGGGDIDDGDVGGGGDETGIGRGI